MLATAGESAVYLWDLDEGTSVTIPFKAGQQQGISVCLPIKYVC